MDINKLILDLSIESLKTAFEFQNNVIIKKTKNGWVAKCKKGLFLIKGKEEYVVKNEAMRYFLQYKKDGEYKK